LDLHRLLDLHERFAQVVLDQFNSSVVPEG
jgi:hypothetical protein